MIQLRKRHSRQFGWFIAGLLCTFLFSFVVPSIEQPVTAASDVNAVERFMTSHHTSFIVPAFEEVAASHLEPNFYK